MKIEEIFKIVQEGKIVKFNECIYRMEGVWLVRIFKGVKTELFSTTHMGADNFEIVKEEKTLSSKIITADGLHHEAEVCLAEEVKQFITDIKGYLNKIPFDDIEEHPSDFPRLVMDEIDKRAGERLV